MVTEHVLIFYDNTSVVNMAKNSVRHKRTKSIDVRHHFLIDNMEKGNISMEFCKTKEQIANIFTKTLSTNHYERNHLKLGLIMLN